MINLNATVVFRSEVTASVDRWRVNNYAFFDDGSGEPYITGVLSGYRVVGEVVTLTRQVPFTITNEDLPGGLATLYSQSVSAIETYLNGNNLLPA